jgi:WD40 repeat protein
MRNALLIAALALCLASMSVGCQGGNAPSGKDDKPAESAKDRPGKSDPNPPISKPNDPPFKIRNHAYLGISADFKEIARSDSTGVTTTGVTVVDLEGGKDITSLKWDQEWKYPTSAFFGTDFVAVVLADSVKVFSRKTGELEQNIHGHVDRASLTSDGKVLAFTEFRSGEGEFTSGNGFHLVLRSIQGKKTIADVPLGSNGYCSLSVAGNRVAAYESNDDQFTIVDAESGKVLKAFNSGSFRKPKEFGESRVPIAVSPTGNLIACEAEDSVALFDFVTGKVVHTLEGHLDVIQAVVFSPDGETVASAAKDKTIRFWNVKDGKEIRAIKDLRTSATELAFSADGKMIAVLYGSEEFGRTGKPEIRSVDIK